MKAKNWPERIRQMPHDLDLSRPTVGEKDESAEMGQGDKRRQMRYDETV